MQKENEKQEETSEDLVSPKKINYTIQTMDFDLKNKNPKIDSLEMKGSEKYEDKIDLKKKVVLEEKKETPQKFNPFLEEIKPSENTPPEVPPKPNNENVIKRQEPELPKPVIKPLEKLPREKSFSNNYLWIFLFVLSLVTTVSGIYYFYFKNPSIKEPPTTKVPEIIIEPEIAKEDLISEKIKDTNLLDITNNDLASLIAKNKTELSQSVIKYYKTSQDLKDLTPSDFLSFLEIQLPENILKNLQDHRLFFYNQKDVLKMGLLFEINKADEIETEIKNNEYRLPELLKPLFVDEIFALQDDIINFKDSEVLTGVRYYNFLEGFDNKSIDWGIVENKFLIITTSKESAGVVIDNLKNLTQPFIEEKLETEIENQ